jgi:hypothetical protein
MFKNVFSRNKPISNSVTYGETCFMSFYAASVTRMSYFDDNKFIQLYNQIIGNVIPTSILSGINKVVLEKDEAFMTGNTIQACTKGVWLYNGII